MRRWLIDIRRNKGYSQKIVCDYVGISQPTYWEYEHGESTPTPAKAKKIGELLDFDWTLFFSDEEGGADRDDRGDQERKERGH